MFAAPEGFAHIYLRVCFAVDVNQTKHNEFSFLVCTICIVAGNITSLHFNAAL